MRNYQTLAAVTAGGSAEATFTNYSRHALGAADITISVNTGTAIKTVDLSDQSWSGAGGPVNNNLGKLLVCYRPTSSSTDSQILPLTAHDFVQPVAGGTLLATIPSIGTAT
jgi:redox-regulated HSP33 family molecular chaperone